MLEKGKKGRKGGSRKVNAVEVETEPIWVSRNCAIFIHSPNIVSVFLPVDWPGHRYMNSLADCQMPLKHALRVVLSFVDLNFSRVKFG